MIKILFSFFILLFSFFFQITVLPYLEVMGVRGDLLFVLVVYFSLKYGWKFGCFFGLCAGLLQDSFSVGKFGLGIATLGMAGLWGGSFSKTLFTDNLISKVVVFLVILGMHTILSFIILKIFSGVPLGFLKEISVPLLIYNFVLAIFVFMGLEKIYHAI